MQEGFGDASEYNEPLNSDNQVSFFGEPIKELAKEESQADLTFTRQSTQGQEEQPAEENNFRHQPANNQGAGLW
jgi:hypothetical protein